MLKDSKGDLCASWDAMDRLTTLRHTEILASFERSIIITEHRFKVPLYKNMRGFVATKALHLMHDEQRRITGRHGTGRGLIPEKVCGCMLKVTHGLPCACALSSFSSIPFTAVHGFWKRLALDAAPVADTNTSSSLDLQAEIDGLIAHFNTLNDTGKHFVKRKVREIFCPESSSLCPPTDQIKTKGRPKQSKPSKAQSIGSLKRDPSFYEHVDNFLSAHDSNTTPSLATCPPPTLPSTSKGKKSKKITTTPVPVTVASQSPYLELLPSYFRQHIDKVIDVVGDGNCGYRAVAALLGNGKTQDDWHWVRYELTDELLKQREFYQKMWSGDDTVREVLNRLSLRPGQVATEDKWLGLPEMGYIIASRFQVVFVQISNGGCYTFLPLYGGCPPHKHHIIALGHINNNHFVQVFCGSINRILNRPICFIYQQCVFVQCS